MNKNSLNTNPSFTTAFGFHDTVDTFMLTSCLTGNTDASESKFPNVGLRLELQVVKKQFNIYKEPYSKQLIETPDRTLCTSNLSCTVPVSGYIRCPDRETISPTYRDTISQIEYSNSYTEYSNTIFSIRSHP